MHRQTANAIPTLASAIDFHSADAFPCPISLTARLDALRAVMAPRFKPDGSCQEENAIAARIAELHDRLGGFIKPSATADSLIKTPDRIQKDTRVGGLSI